MLARIFKPSKSAMSSGRARTRDWLLEFEPASARSPDPLMGWTSSGDMDGQVRMAFETSDEAAAYCRQHGIAFQLTPEKAGRHVIKAYADNFSATRRIPWTH